MKQKQQLAASVSAAEAAVLRRGPTSGSLSTGNNNNSRIGTRPFFPKTASIMASSSPSDRSCSSWPPPKTSSSLHHCGEGANVNVATTSTCLVESVAVTETASTNKMMPTDGRYTNESITIAPSYPPPFLTSCLCYSCRSSAPMSSSSSAGADLLHSPCRKCASNQCAFHSCSVLPSATSPSSAAELSGETFSSGCFPYYHPQHPNSFYSKWHQLPGNLSCRSNSITTTVDFSGNTAIYLCNSKWRRPRVRGVRYPLLLQLPAIITVAMISLLLLPHGPQEAAAQLKFAALGNWGFESGSQQQVADTLKKVARTEHLSLLISPGSNFAGGVTGADDPKWKRLFEDVYSDPSGALKMPFFTVLGAEDWSGNYTAQALRTTVAYSPTGKYALPTASTGTASEETPEVTTQNEEDLHTSGSADATSAAMENQLATTYPKWTLPNWWYHYVTHFSASTGTAFINSGHKDMSVGLIFLDTWVLSSSFPFSDVRTKAWEDAEKTLSLATVLLDFIIVVTDRPIFSSGSSKGDSALQYYLKPLIEKADVDLYISGYDLNQEIIVNRGITYVNCGAGSFGVGSSMVKDRGSQFYAGQAGFCLFELNAEGVVTRLVDGLNGETLFTYKQVLKRRPERKKIDAFTFINQMPKVKYLAVPSMGKMPGRDVFVRVVGTIGLCIATFFASLSVASLVSRYTK